MAFFLKRKTTKAVMLSFVLIAAIQAVLISLKYIVFMVVNKTVFSERIETMTAMLFLTALFILYAKIKNVPLSVFPKRFNRFYIAASIGAVAVLISTPSNYTGGIKPIVLLFYGSVVTPIFEELIFRGYIWNKLSAVFSKSKQVYIINALLFSIWHIGYVLPLAFEGNQGFLTALLSKLGVGLIYGLILGALRLKTKNTYSTILLHGVMNVFAF